MFGKSLTAKDFLIFPIIIAFNKVHYRMIFAITTNLVSRCKRCNARRPNAIPADNRCGNNRNEFTVDPVLICIVSGPADHAIT